MKDGPLLTAQWLDTPIGAMLAVVDDIGVHLLEFADRPALPGEICRLEQRVSPICFGNSPILDSAADQLQAYFAGDSAAFHLSIVQRGTSFEASVWAALREVPAGRTRTYGALAQALGHPAAVRAVGRANGANQVAIMVPCHRIIGADGSPVGYGGKIWRRKWLLEHERRFASSLAA